MPITHSEAGKSHDYPNLVPHLRIVAMYTTLGACCLTFLERAFLKAFQRIICNLSAFPAKFSILMVAAAVNRYHGLNSFALSCYS